MPLQRAISAFLCRPPLLIVGASVLALALTALTALSLWEMCVDALAFGEPSEGSTRGKLTVSIGVAVHPGIVTADDTPQDLVRLADGRPYEAKAAGRNTVIPRQERLKLAVV